MHPAARPSEPPSLGAVLGSGDRCNPAARAGAWRHVPFTSTRVAYFQLALSFCTVFRPFSPLPVSLLSPSVFSLPSRYWTARVQPIIVAWPPIRCRCDLLRGRGSLIPVQCIVWHAVPLPPVPLLLCVSCCALLPSCSAASSLARFPASLLCCSCLFVFPPCCLLPFPACAAAVHAFG